MKNKATKSAGKTKPVAPPFSFASPPSTQSSSSALDTRASSAAIPLPASDVKLHPPSTLSHPGPTVRCPDCGKPVLRAALGDHAVNCQRIRDGPQADSTSDLKSDAGGDDYSSYGGGDIPMSTRKRRLSDASMTTATPPPSSKKAKAAPSAATSTSASLVPERPSPAPSGSEAGTSSVGGLGGSNWGGESTNRKGRSKTEKKLAKERKDAEKRMQKAEPLDLDRRCGVINDKNTPCLRSLTCKSHGMGPKRDVQGRSKPFDVLLQEWNTINNPRLLELKGKRNGNGTSTYDAQGNENGSLGVGGSGSGKKRNHHGGKSRRNRDDDSMDGGGRSSPESELNSLITAAKASRSRLSAPSPSVASLASLAFNNASGRPSSPPRPLSAVPSSLRTGAPLAVRGGGGTLMGGIPREGWKGSLYGRRRGLTTELNRSLRNALGVK